MADIDIERPEPLVDVVGFRLSWGAIFAGFVIATVTQVVLSVLGMAIGFSAWNPATGGFAGMGIGAAIWFVITAIVSLFLGGLALGRLAGILKTKDAVLHGIVMWGLSTLVAVWMVANGVGALVGTTFGALTQTASAAVEGATASAGASANPMQRMQTAVDSAQARLRAEAQQHMPPAGVTQAEAGEVATTTTHALGTTAWVALVVMLLSLGAAMWGSAITAND